MNINKIVLKDEIEKFLGRGKHRTHSNICYGDAYYALSLERKYGKSIEELRKMVGMEHDEPFADSLAGDRSKGGY